MTHTDAPRTAANTLWNHWQAGTVLDALPDTCRPRARAEGYAAQAQLPLVSGREVEGWKIAATSAVGQAHINVGGPLAGRLLSGQIIAAGGTVPSAGNRMRVAEPEMAFRMARDLPPRPEPYGVDEVLAAVASLHPALEVPDSRFADFTAAGEAQLLADNACARHFVPGPAAPDGWRALDLSTHAVQAQVTPAHGPACLEPPRHGRRSARRPADRADLAGQRTQQPRHRPAGRALRHHRHLHGPAGAEARRCGGGRFRCPGPGVDALREPVTLCKSAG